MASSTRKSASFFTKDSVLPGPYITRDLELWGPRSKPPGGLFPGGGGQFTLTPMPFTNLHFGSGLL